MVLINKSRFNAYQTMWLYVFFDLPVNTDIHRKRYARFRKNLMRDGFTMVQFSVYHRHCASPESVDVHKKRIKAMVPSEGMVSVMAITDKQFALIEHFVAGKKPLPASIPQQLEFF
ncbi:MAG: CRISPR-associated endonuclease Cas2 [Bacteroidia bacterium]